MHTRTQRSRIICVTLLVTISTTLAVGDLCPAARADSSGASTLLLTDLQTASSTTEPWSGIRALIDGVSPPPSTPGELVGYSGSPSLLTEFMVKLLDDIKPLETRLGINPFDAIIPLIEKPAPPQLYEALHGLNVTETNYDGMPVYELSPDDPSGQYVVAIHGGAYVYQATTEQWSAYTEMAQKTDATIVVPIYPVAPEGTAGTVEPEIAGLISSEIAQEGANNVSVYGDSAGGGIALAAVELMASDGQTMPGSMVLDSPTLELAFDNPDISLIDDPVLSVAEGQADGLLWAGGLPLTDPIVSPLYGSLADLPPTYVYSGSDEILAPDVLALEEKAIAQDAPFSFILRTGEFHDWALVPILDGAQVQQQIYQELGLTDVGAEAGGPNIVGALQDWLQSLAAGMSTHSVIGSLGLSELSAEVSNSFAAMATDATALWGDMSTLFSDAFALF